MLRISRSLSRRNLYDKLQIPIGLISSAYGGTRIEAWATAQSLEACSVPDHVNDATPQQSTSYVYNAMMAPFRKIVVAGFLWYQGSV